MIQCDKIERLKGVPELAASNVTSMVVCLKDESHCKYAPNLRQQTCCFQRPFLYGLLDRYLIKFSSKQPHNPLLPIGSCHGPAPVLAFICVMGTFELPLLIQACIFLFFLVAFSHSPKHPLKRKPGETAVFPSWP